uniref:Galectin n=2 Tax=Meloidogyne TaxID=189290 RepID=A0A914NQB8_MELIC
MSTHQKIDRDSGNAITNALSFFETPHTNVSISNSSFIELLTLNPVNITPFHFKIHASTNYVDLAKCYVLTELRIRKEDEHGRLTNLEAADNNVSCCQLIGHTIWKNCRISINGTQIFEGNSLMAYKSIFDYELTYPQTVKNSYLSSAGYYDDGDLGLNGVGFENRRLLFAPSADGTQKSAQFMAKLDVDICNQPRYLINQCEVDIELLPNESNFLIVAPGATNHKYHLEILACKLYIKKIELMDSLAFDIAKKLELKPARYPMRKTSLKSLFISENRTEFNANLWMDQVPRRVVLGMVKNADFVGSQKTHPFNFQHFNLRDISITAGGVTFPAAPYSLDFPNGKYVRIYHDMQEAIGYAGTLESNGISMQRFSNGGFCLLVFNLTNSQEDNGPEMFDLIKNGTTSIRMTFNEPVPNGGIVLVAMGEIDSLLMLDRNRTISTDISV